MGSLLLALVPWVVATAGRPQDSVRETCVQAVELASLAGDAVVDLVSVGIATAEVLLDHVRENAALAHRVAVVAIAAERGPQAGQAETRRQSRGGECRLSLL
jgi:hypothetical protein